MATVQNLPRNPPASWPIVLLALLALAGALGLDLYAGYKRVAAQEQTSLTRHAGFISRQLTSQMEATRQALDSIQAELHAPDLSRDNLLLNRRLESLARIIPGLRTLVVLNAAGVTVASNRKELIGLRNDGNERFQTMRSFSDPDLFYVSPPFVTPSGLHTISTGKVIVDPDGNFNGCILAVFEPEHFNVLLESVLYAPDMQAALAHAEGKMISVQNLADAGSGQVMESLFQRYQAGSQNSNTGSAALGTAENFAVFSPVTVDFSYPDQPLVIGVSREHSALYASWRRDLAVRFLMFGIIVLLATGGMFLRQRVRADRARALDLCQDQQSREEESSRKADAEARFHAVFDQAPLGIALVDAQTGMIEELNARFCSILGQSREDLTASAWLKLPGRHDPDDGRQDYAGTRIPWRIENPHLQPDGSTVWTSTLITRLALPDGSSADFIAMLDDITQHKQAELELRENEQRLQLALSAAALAVWDWHVPDGRLHFSPYLARLLGRTGQEMPADIDSWEAGIFPDDLGSLRQEFERHLQGETPCCHVEYRVRHKQGQWIRLESLGRVVERDDAGYPIRIAGIVFECAGHGQTGFARS